MALLLVPQQGHPAKGAVMTDEGPIFLPMYTRTDLRPVAVIGWICALIALITVYTWIVVQLNDAYYAGVTNSRCHIIYERVPELNGRGQATAFSYDKEVSRHLEVLTDERDNVHNWQKIEADCKE
jgi:hypothetical protein